MRRIVLLLLCLVTASLVTTATVHAREFSSVQTTIECTGAVHTDGDSDQSQGDADKNVPHHHGTCHGAPLYVPAKTGDATPVLKAVKPVFIPIGVGSTRWFVDPALRPPIA